MRAANLAAPLENRDISELESRERSASEAFEGRRRSW